MYFSDPDTVEMLIRFSRPSRKELEALKVILFLMEPIRNMFLAFLDPNLSALERLDLAFRSCFRLQFWYWERQTHRGERMDALPFITFPCYDGYLQVLLVSNLFRTSKISSASMWRLFTLGLRKTFPSTRGFLAVRSPRN